MSVQPHSLPVGWRWSKLGEFLCSIEAGKSPKAQERPANPEEWGVLKVSAVTWGEFRHQENKALFPESDPNGIPTVSAGDLLISRANTVELVGAVAMAKENHPRLILSDKTLRLNPNLSLINPIYLLYALRTPNARRHLESHATGTSGSMQNISQANIRSTPIALPPLEEQHRIAAILDKADAVRRKRKEAIALTEELLRSAFLEMFGELSAKDWQMTTIEHIAASHKGSLRTGPFGSQLLHSEFVDEGIAVLGIDNAVQNQFSWAKPRFITEAKYKQLKRYTVRPEDVIITIMGTCGRCAIVPENCPTAINTKHLCCITLDQTKCIPEFLHSYFLLHPQARQYLEKNVKGAIMDGLNLTIIKDLPVPVAPIDLQKKYKTLSSKIQNLKKQHTDSSNSQTELFNSLLQRAFRGER